MWEEIVLERVKVEIYLLVPGKMIRKFDQLLNCSLNKIMEMRMRMTIAEIHGKLTPYDRMEDLLTSDVFSTFRYLNPNKGLVPFLKHARGALNPSNPGFLSGVEEADYLFWPRTTKLNREPDVLIILTKKDGSTISILIEAKYTSGKSNILREEITDETEHFDGDQLAELYKELQEGNIYMEDQQIRDKFHKSAGNRYLFYTTAHYVFPKKDFEETFSVIKKYQYGQHHYENFYWVNWISIHNSIDEVATSKEWTGDFSMRLLLLDLKDLLNRKGLTPFYGFSNLQLQVVNTPEFFFWKEDNPNNNKTLLSDIKAIKKQNTSYFWTEE